MKKTMIQLRRRRVVAGLGVLATALALPRAWAQSDFPRMPIKLVVGFAAGGATDSFARLIATRLSERVGQPVIVENRPGAGGTIAAEFVARSKPDGYTLLIADIGPNAIAQTLYPKLGYDVVASFAPISYSIDIPYVLVVHPSMPSTLDGLLAHAKSKPGSVNYASAGAGGLAHLAGEMLKLQAGVEITHIPFKGGAPGLAAVLAGDVQMMFVTVPTAMPHVASGKVRAVAVTGRARVQSMPQVPTMQESGLASFVAGSWSGVLAPAGTPPEIVARLSRDMVAVLNEKEVRNRFADAGFDTVGAPADAFGQLIRDETRKWGEIVKASGAKAD